MRRILVMCALGLVALLGASGTAFAHNTLVGSTPEEGAQLRTGPQEVRLDFDQPVRSGEGYNTVTVVGPDGSHWTDAPAQVEGNSVRVPVGELGPAGDYRIGYRVLSNDGHPVSGQVPFTLTEPGDGSPVPAPGAEQDEPAEESGGTPVWPWIVGAVVVVALGLVLALRLGKPRQ